MSRGELSAARAALYSELLTTPLSRWIETEYDEATDGLWQKLCSVIFEGISEELVRLLQAAYSSQHAPFPSHLPVESQALATKLFTLLRVGQSYWGIGITAGRSLAGIGSWRGGVDNGATVDALRHLTHLIRERCPGLEPELFRYAAKQAERRIDTWLRFISPGQADVMVQRYGLRGQPGRTLAEIGQSRGVTRARIQQIEARALRWLGPGVEDELRAAFRAGSRPDALDRAFRSLPSRPGRDVHRTDDLLNLAYLDEAWWPYGIAKVLRDPDTATAPGDRHFVREWLKHSTDAIWLDTGLHFIKRRSENRSPYITAARKLLAIHEAVPITVVHEAVIDTWRSELWGECMLSADWLGALFRSSTLDTEGNCLVSNGRGGFTESLNPSERQLLGALQGLGGLGTLDELRERLPSLRRQGTVLSQTLYGRTPIVHRVGLSVFGIRGAVHDPDRVAILENRALQSGHPWLNRGGWKRDERRSMHYRIPFRHALPDRIRLPNDIADILVDDGEGTGVLIWQTPDGLEYSIGIQESSSGTYLAGVRSVLHGLHASGGATINVTVRPDGVWTIALTEEAPSESVVIRMGRGWTSVAL